MKIKSIILASIIAATPAITAAQTIGGGNVFDPARDEIGIARDATFEGYATAQSVLEWVSSNFNPSEMTQAQLDALAAAINAAATPATLDAAIIDPATVDTDLAEAIATALTDGSVDPAAIDWSGLGADPDAVANINALVTHPVDDDTALQAQADANTAAIASGSTSQAAIDAAQDAAIATNATNTTNNAAAIVAASTAQATTDAAQDAVIAANAAAIAADGDTALGNEYGCATISGTGVFAYDRNGNCDRANFDLASQAELNAAIVAASAAQAAIDAAQDAADLDKIADSFTSTLGTIANSGTADALNLDLAPNPLVDPGVGTWRLSNEGSSVSITPNGQVNGHSGQTNTFRVGNTAGLQSQGGDINAIGRNSAYQALGSGINALGALAAYQSQGDDINGFGPVAAYQSLGSGINAIGRNSAYQFKGSDAIALGRGSAYQAQGSDVIAIGRNSAYQFQGNGATVVGLNAAYQAQGDGVTAIGTNANTSKIIGSLQNATIDPTGDEVTATSHGIGSVGDIAYIWVQSSTPPAGVANAWHAVEVIDANTLLFLYANPTTSGAGVQVAADANAGQSNWTALGANAMATTGNQIMLGDPNVTEVFTYGDITANGTFYASDKRLKTNIEALDDPAAIIAALSVVSFEWDFEAPEMTIVPASGDQPAITRVPLRAKDQPQIGLIAQEVEAVLPEAVTTRNGIKQVDYAKVSIVSIAAVKQLTEQMAEMQAQIDALSK